MAWERERRREREEYVPVLRAMAMTPLAKSSVWGGTAVVVKLVLDALGRQLKDSGGWFLRYVVRGALGGANLVSGWTSAFQMTVVLNGAVPTVGPGISAGFALVYWVVLHVVGRKLFFAQSLPPAVVKQQAEVMSKAQRWEAPDEQRQATEAAAAESPSAKLEKLSADLKNISDRQIEFADLRQAAFCADWSDDEVTLVLQKAARSAPGVPAPILCPLFCSRGVSGGCRVILPLCTSRADKADDDEVNAVLKELEACTDAAMRQLRLSAFDKAEQEKRELLSQETQLEETISSLDNSRDSAEIAAVSFCCQLRLTVHLMRASNLVQHRGVALVSLCCAVMLGG